MDKYTIHFDGSCWPNPGGLAAYGYVIHCNDVMIYNGHGIIGENERMSNNVSEFFSLYQSLNQLLRHLIENNHTGKLTVNVFGDSMLTVNIMNKKWRAKSQKLYFDAYKYALGESIKLNKIGVSLLYSWIPREENEQADILSKAHENNLK